MSKPDDSDKAENGGPSAIEQYLVKDPERFALNMARMIEQAGKAASAWTEPREKGEVRDHVAEPVVDMVKTFSRLSEYWLGDPQRALEASGTLQPPYAVVKVAHHGSADQDAALYAAAAPSVAFVTVGAGNDYGHPRAEILDALTGLGARIARTDVDGIVAMWGSGDAVSVWRERGG